MGVQISWYEERKEEEACAQYRRHFEFYVVPWLTKIRRMFPLCLVTMFVRSQDSAELMPHRLRSRTSELRGSVLRNRRS